jgi:hypothetical protein
MKNGEGIVKNCLLLLLILSLACENSSEKMDRQSRVPLPQRQQAPAGQAAIKWQAPEGWLAEQPSSSMRQAQFSLPGTRENASVIVFYFGGQGGGVEGNLARWQGMFKSDGVASKPTVRETEVNGLAQTIIDITGTYLFKPRPMAPTSIEKPDHRMLAAVIETNSGPWFVRCVGPRETVAKWENSFYAFLGSIKQ